jgi:outer membrane protein OmpA-like peptidoglycan-associated protein
MTKEFTNNNSEPNPETNPQPDTESLDSFENLLRLLTDLAVTEKAKKDRAAKKQKIEIPQIESAKSSVSAPQNSGNLNGDRLQSRNGMHPERNRIQSAFSASSSAASDNKTKNFQPSESRRNGTSNGDGQNDNWRDRIKEILATPIQTKTSSSLAKLQFDDLTYESALEVQLSDESSFSNYKIIGTRTDNSFLDLPDDSQDERDHTIQAADIESEFDPDIHRSKIPDLSSLLGDLNGLSSPTRENQENLYDFRISREVSLPLKEDLVDSTISQPASISQPANETAQLQVLQNILVEPELVEVRQLLEVVELKLNTLQTQVNDPAMEQKLKELEEQMSDTSEIGDMQKKLVELTSQQTNLLTNFPTEIANLRQRLIEIEHHIYEPEQLVGLLMPVIADLLNRKVAESKHDISQAIVPIIDSVIYQRIQEDKAAMSDALAEIMPAAISRQIQNSPKEIAIAIGPEIGAAIKEQIRLDQDVIANALAPEMGAAIKQQILLERDAMVDALYPVIGNTISKYLSEAIRQINQRVENTFSIQGVQRKFRAKMQGVSEAELILKESMPYQVQAVFLIQKDSGLVIIDIQQSSDDPNAQVLESEMVAGMLTAIRTFVNDCIARSGSVSELDNIDYSGSKIVLEVAGYCYLAVVIQGEPDKKFILKIRDTLGVLIQKYGKPIEQFEGDPSMIPQEANQLLRTLLDKPDPEKSAKSTRGLLILGLVVMGLILVPWGYFQYRSSLDRRLEAKTANAIASTPELAVYRLNVAANGDKLKLSGQLPNQYLRDRVVQVIQQANQAEYPKLAIDNQIFAVDVPPDPVLAAAEVERATALLNQKPGTAIAATFKGDKITIAGKVTDPEIAAQITQALAQIPGVKYITNTVIIQPPEIKTRVYFYTGLYDLRPEDMARIAEVAAYMERYPSYNLKILGRSDPIGDPFSNQQLASNRAQAVYDALVQKGIDRKRLQAIGLDHHINATNPKEPLWMSRRVEFVPVPGAR